MNENPMTEAVLAQLLSEAENGLNPTVPLSVLGLDPVEVMAWAKDNTIECICVPESEFLADDTYIWWSSTETSQGEVLWGVDTANHLVWVEGTFRTLVEARVAAEARGQEIIRAAR